MPARELRLAIIGDPVAHSLSPVMQVAALRAAGICGTYRRIQVSAGCLATRVNELRCGGLDGFNVTIPHKEAIFRYVDGCDRVAASVGAVNTVTAGDDDFGRPKWTGYNTDFTGFQRVIDRTGIFDKGPGRRGVAVVLGAGGAARAVVAGLAERADRIVIANRSIARAQSLVRSMDQEVRDRLVVAPLTSVALAPFLDSAVLLVNTTSVGMKAPDDSPLPEDLTLSPLLAVCDLVYGPVRTGLLRSAEAMGCRTVDGIELLVAQGADAFELWTGLRPDEDVMRAAVVRDRNI